MNTYRYEKYLDDMFYTSSELVDLNVQILEDTLYIKNEFFFKSYIVNGKPTDELFLRFLNQSGMYLFLIDVLNDKRKSKINFYYNGKVIAIYKSTIYSFYKALSSKTNDSKLLSKISVILKSNELEETKLTNYLTDETLFSKLIYDKDEARKKRRIGDILNYLYKFDILNKYDLDDILVERINKLKQLLDFDSIKESINHIKYVLNSSLIEELEKYNKDTFSKLEKAVFYFIALTKNLKIVNDDEKIDSKTIYSITKENNQVTIEAFYIILITILEDIGIEFETSKDSLGYDVKILNKITFRIHNKIDLTTDISTALEADNEMIYQILSYYDTSEKNAYDFEKNVKIYESLIDDKDISARNKLKTFLELICRENVIADDNYQMLMFNIFYEDDDACSIEFYKILNESENYDFFTIIRIKNKNIIIGKKIKKSIKIISDFEYQEFIKRSINIKNNYMEGSKKHVG